MATSASNAYTTLQQFSPKSTKTEGTPLGRYQAAQIGLDKTVGPTFSEELSRFASAAQDMYGAYTRTQDIMTDVATKKVDAWMNRLTIDEYRQAMRENNVPFQDDKLAMSVLHNKAAYNMALETEEAVQRKITSGDFKSLQEADEYRISALEGARAEYALSFGISPDDESFRGGFDRDSERRRELLLKIQTDVQDKALREQAKITSKANVLAPLTPDFIAKAPGEFAAQYVQNTINQDTKLGQIRSDAEAVELYSAAVEHLTGQTGGAKVIEALGKLEVPMGGQKHTLRDILGGGVFDQAKIKALNLEQQQSANRQGALNAGLYDKASRNDISGLLADRDRLSRESGGVQTQELNEVDNVIRQTKLKIDHENAVAQEQYAKELEKDGRINTAVSTMRGILDGTLTAVSPRGTDMGLKDEAEARQAEERLIQGFPEGPQRWAAIMRLASFRPDGYADSALKAMNTQASASWSQYRSKVARGEQADVPKQVQQMTTLYAQDPVSFQGALKNPEYVTVIESGKQLGMSPEEVAKAQIAFGKLSTDQKKTLETELRNKLSGDSFKSTAYTSSTLRTMAGHYLSLDVEPEMAVQLAKEDFLKQHTSFAGSPIHNSFFAFTGEKDSFEKGKAIFDATVEHQRELLKAPGDSMSLLYDHNNQVVRFINLKTGEQSPPIGRGDLRLAFEKQAKANKKTQPDINKVIKQEQNVINKRKKVFDSTTPADVLRAASPFQ